MTQDKFRKGFKTRVTIYGFIAGIAAVILGATLGSGFIIFIGFASLLIHALAQ